MNKQEAKRLLETTFNHSFDETQFTSFIQEFLDGMEYRDNQLAGGRMYQAYADHISSYKRIGKYTDPDGNELDVLIVRVNRSEKLDRTRTALRNFVIRHLDEFGKDYALVAFYSTEDDGADWRFSFIKLEYESVLDDKGKVKVSRRETPAKRYSFLVGENEKGHTAKRQILDILLKFYQPTVEQIEEAFSIETVTDEFFEQYKELYVNIQEYLEDEPTIKGALEEVGIDTIRFTKKLLGQIVFLYFLQKKGWLGAAQGEPIIKGERSFVQKLFSQSKIEGKNFYNSYLKYLFYEALAKERVDHYYERLNCQIPFLNGGLFEAQHDWKSDVIQIPDRFFRNQIKTKSGDIGTGVLDVFDRYNFTIKEDEPLEKEVAVDPEMLGKVFENMLEIKERKSKGAFYTPREIVHYMCQESLIHYLDNVLNDYSSTHNKLGEPQGSLFNPNEGKKGQQAFAISKQQIKVPKKNIEEFIRKGHFALENDRRVLETGKETKGYSFQTPESVRLEVNAIDEQLANIKICDPAIGSGAFPVGLLHEIVQARQILQLFKKDQTRLSPYQLKRHAIENSIYGVDIDASAIDIARLRLWLSMIVDENDFEHISTLPNLDYKLVCGNALIGIPDDLPRNYSLEDEIVFLKEKFLRETEDESKKELRENINQKIHQFIATAEGFTGYSIDFDFRLYFSEIWQQKDGFDIVIGNPPYVFGGSKQIASKQKLIFKRTYFSGSNKINLFTLFIEKGHKLLNKAASLNYIVPNTLLRVTSYSNIREYLIDRTSLLEIVDLDIGIFKRVTASTIIIRVGKTHNKSLSNAISIKRGIGERILQKITQSEFNRKGYVFDIFSNDIDRLILKKLQFNSIPLEKMTRLIRFGVVISGNFDEVVSSKKKGDNWKPFLEGEEIGTYEIDYKGRYLDYTKEKLHRSRTPDVFENKKIMIQRITGGNNPLKAVYDDKNFYNKESIINIILNSTKFEYYYILALLNSDLINWFYAKRFTNFSKLTVNLSKEYLGEIPIKVPTDRETKIICTLVDYVITTLRDSNKNVLQFKFFKALIDSVIFELYFSDEIKTANKEIITHLQNLIALNDFERSQDEKNAIIQKEFSRLYDPYHPVRNNMETLDSIEEIRIIKEALK